MSNYAKIEATTVESRYARGWHCLGLASSYGKEPTPLRYFDTNLVAFRGDDDKLVILDGYCPHMGADLSKGYIEGNSLRCPFHSWSWGADGVCDDIPYAKRIPAKARIKAWPVMEENNFLFVWNDPEDNPPIASQIPPKIDECFSDDWSDWVVDLMKIPTNCRELVDNMADNAHFGPVHGAASVKFQNRFHQHVCVQDMQSKSPRLAGDSILSTVATYYGPAYMITRMSGEMGGVPVESILLVSHVPTSTETFDLRFGVMVKLFPGMDESASRAMVEEYVKLSQAAFTEDVDIWVSKVRVDNPILCDGDGPVNRLRQWYKQFYVDAADVPSTWDEEKVYNSEAFNPIPEHRL